MIKKKHFLQKNTSKICLIKIISLKLHLEIQFKRSVLSLYNEILEHL